MSCTDEVLGPVVERVPTAAEDYTQHDLNQLRAAGLLVIAAAHVVGERYARASVRCWEPADPKDGKATAAEVKRLMEPLDAATSLARQTLHQVKVAALLRAFDRVQAQGTASR